MAKQLIFQTDQKDHPCDIVRLDRKKLYGWKDLEAIGPDGTPCIRVDIDETGSFIIPKGGKALGNIGLDGRWVEKSDLKAVDSNGKPAVLKPSSFDSPITLDTTVDIETYLDHSIDSVYIINPDDTIKESLTTIIRSAKGIFTFPFNYRPDYAPKTAFLIEANNNIYMLIGTVTEFEFIGLEQMADLNVSDEEDDDFNIEDDLDFSMM
ncbi:MAG: hypothetical protein OMM_00924 [Candidatus Magnetoglobus multicellularis str. Araruama]|uniref:Uncharacterized protein n=1 Tax=Candidatus Magnetoglobus multicellularis str. Araruama TaxID=890399 RepID=A0A1V1PFC4_9BACT|nr:MAG: hypothetical protein OMM_00924 [Candidatus Magnetoglobus multicellularis str. Araruama]